MSDYVDGMMDQIRRQKAVTHAMSVAENFLGDLEDIELLALAEMIEHGRTRDNIHDWMKAKETQNV